MTDRCQSCGVPWAEHVGIAGTCAELTRLRKALHEILMVEHVHADGRQNSIRENAWRRKLALEALKGK